MSVDILVKCRCWERGLCKPCPIDASRLVMEDDEGGGHPWLVEGYSSEELQTLCHWSKMACTHSDGFAMSDRMCSSHMVPLIIQELQGEWAGTCPVLLSCLDKVSTFGAAGSEDQEAAVILHEIETLYAAGFADGLTETGPDTVAGILDVLHRAAKAAAEQRTNIVWS
jgi:hypothetical protein